MRLMSFAMTIGPLLCGIKTVTRRMGWIDARPGQMIMAVDKAMGLRGGAKPWRMGPAVIVEHSRQRLDLIDQADVEAEGFPGMRPEEFIELFRKANRCAPDAPITRIVFRQPTAQEMPGDLMPMGAPARWFESGIEQRGHAIGMVPANISPSSFISRTAARLKARRPVSLMSPSIPTVDRRTILMLGLDGSLAWPAAAPERLNDMPPLRETLRRTGAMP